MPANRMWRSAERTLRRHATDQLGTDAGPPEARDGEPADDNRPAGGIEPPVLIGAGGQRVDPAALLNRRGERLWLLGAPGAGGPDPLAWLLRAAWHRAATDAAVAQRPVLVDLARLAAEGPVTADQVLLAVTGAATAHGYLVLLAGLDAAGGAVRAAVAGLPGPLARAAPASTIVTLSHAEPVPGFHIPAVVLQPARPRRETPTGEAAWTALAGRLSTQRPWPAGLLADVVAACTAAPEELRWRIIDDLAALPDRRLLFRAAVAAGACDDDGVCRAARIEIESLAGVPPAARDRLWLSRLLVLLPVLDAEAPPPAPETPATTTNPHDDATSQPEPPPTETSQDERPPTETSQKARPTTAPPQEEQPTNAHPAGEVPPAAGLPAEAPPPASARDAKPSAVAVLLRMAAGRPGSAPLTVLARRDPDAAVAAAEASGDPRDLEAVTRSADEPAVLRAVLGRCAAVPGWEAALVYAAQLDRAVANALQHEPDPEAAPVEAGRWREFPLTRATAYGRLLDDVLARPWAWPPHAAPLLFTLSGVRPPSSALPALVATLPRAATGAVLAALTVLACGRLTDPHITPLAATSAVGAGLAVAGLVLARRLHRWRTATPGPTAAPSNTAAPSDTAAGNGDTPDTATPSSTGTPDGTARPDMTAMTENDTMAGALPLLREHVLAAVLNLAGRRLDGVVPERYMLDEPLRQACIRAGVPEVEITHLLNAVIARDATLGGVPPAAVPEQAFRLDERQPRR
jgi:hypothetical protein